MEVEEWHQWWRQVQGLALASPSLVMRCSAKVVALAEVAVAAVVAKLPVSFSWLVEGSLLSAVAVVQQSRSSPDLGFEHLELLPASSWQLSKGHLVVEVAEEQESQKPQALQVGLLALLPGKQRKLIENWVVVAVALVEYQS